MEPSRKISLRNKYYGNCTLNISCTCVICIFKRMQKSTMYTLFVVDLQNLFEIKDE